MPCDQVSTVTVELGKADPALLALAMAKLHPNLNYSFNDGQLFISGRRTVDVAAIKQEVAKQSVLRQAKRFGWSVREQPNGKLLLQKARL